MHISWGSYEAYPNLTKRRYGWPLLISNGKWVISFNILLFILFSQNLIYWAFVDGNVEWLKRRGNLNCWKRSLSFGAGATTMGYIVCDSYLTSALPPAAVKRLSPSWNSILSSSNNKNFNGSDLTKVQDITVVADEITEVRDVFGLWNGWCNSSRPLTGS